LSSLAGAGFVVFILVLFAGIYLSLFGLPGTVVIFLDVLVYAALTGFGQVGGRVLLTLVIIAAVAEALDYALGKPSAHKAYAPSRAGWFLLAGSIIGMFALTPFLWGAGIWLGFYLGGLAGLFIAEVRRQLKLKSPYQASALIFWTMTARKTVKGAFSVIMIFVALNNIYS
jgi:hypothetical protein